MSQLSAAHVAAFVLIVLIFGCYGAHRGKEKKFPFCHGKFHDPIHEEDNAHMVKENFTEFVMKEFDVSPTSAELRNTGETIMINFKFDQTPTIEGGSLKYLGVYKFSHIQFHWLDTESLEPFHGFPNISFPVELHIVFIKQKYDSINQAQMVHDGIVVLAFSMEIGGDDSGEFEELIGLIDQVRQPNNSASFANPPQLKDLMHKYIAKYYRYSGTWLSPPCIADVIWIDFESKIALSVRQIGNDDSREFEELIGLLDQVRQPNNSASFANPPQLKDLMQQNRAKYYTYSGSWLSPPCSADVIWIDFEIKIALSVRQYSTLEKFGDNWSMKKNPHLGGIIWDRQLITLKTEGTGNAIPLSYTRNSTIVRSNIVITLWVLLLISLGFL